MQTYHIKLQTEISKSFKCQLAAQSLDIDVEKKSIHELLITADIESKYNIGLIIGASGSGKTTLAKHIFGNDCFKEYLDPTKSLIDQMPKEMSYDECAKIISGVGLTSVPCWIRPAYTLSNGQRARAESVLAMTNNKELTIIDEWTSVVDRTVAKVMSHCVQKHARKEDKKIILLSCHYDVIEWLDPDWIIDCNKQQFIDRRLLSKEERERKEKLEFTIREVDKSTWKYFSKYHYLSDKIPGGLNYFYGLFYNNNQIGFLCFSNYVPKKKGTIAIFHSNRVVIHPDYTGLGIGIKFINKCCEHFKQKYNYKIYAKLSARPLINSRLKDKNNWRLINITNNQNSSHMNKITKFFSYNKRTNVKTYSFIYIGK